MSELSKVYNFKTKNKEGFTNSEVQKLLIDFPNIDMVKFNNAMLCNTCPIIDGEIVNYRHDVVVAIACGIQKRDKPTI